MYVSVTVFSKTVTCIKEPPSAQHTHALCVHPAFIVSGSCVRT